MWRFLVSGMVMLDRVVVFRQVLCFFCQLYAIAAQLFRVSPEITELQGLNPVISACEITKQYSKRILLYAFSSELCSSATTLHRFRTNLTVPAIRLAG